MVLVLVASLSFAVAQDGEDTTYVFKRDVVRADLFKTNSQVRFGTGISSKVFTATPGGGAYYKIDSETIGYEQYADCGYYLDFSYGYRVYEFLEVVAAFSYAEIESINFYSIDSETKERELYLKSSGGTTYYFTLQARYSWINTKWVSMYSSLGVGMAYEPLWVEDAAGVRTDLGEDYSFFPDIMPIGIRVGRQLFGYFEPFCISKRGNFCNVGLGFRF